MARTPADLAREFLDHAQDGNVDGMGELLADDARFYAQELRGRRFKGRGEIEGYLKASGFEATGYSFTPVEADYVVVAVSLRRRIEGGGLADSTVALVFRADGDEIVCLDAFPSTHHALASLRRSNSG